MKQIILSEIISLKNEEAFYNEGFLNYFTAAQQSIIRKAMLEFGNQLLELAAERAKINCKLDHQEGKWCQSQFSLYKSDYNDYTSCTVTVNSDSILNTINQVI